MACDPCKLRRIKCDLLELLSSLDEQHGRGDDEPPHLIVRRHPGAVCTQCRNKGLQCSTEGILNPSKPNKGGRRINEARQKYGDGTDAATPMTADPSMGADLGEKEGLGGPARNGALDQLGAGIEQSGNNGLDATAPDPFATSSSTSHHSWASTPAYATSPSGDSVSYGHDQPFLPRSNDPSDTLLRSLLVNLDSSPPSSNPALNGHPIAYTSGRATPEVQRQAVEIWEKHSMNVPQAVANRSLRPTTPQSHAVTVDLDAHTPHPNTLLPALGRLDIETNTFLPVVPLDSNPPRAASISKPGEAYGGHSGRPETMVRYRGDAHKINQGSQIGKRQREYDSAGSTLSTSAYESLQPWERDPWHIWQAKDEGGSRTVAWSRKEQVQESLADRALGIELSRHLITVYFQAVHFSLPVRTRPYHAAWMTSG